MLHTDGNNPSQPLDLTLVEKEAPEWGVGCAGPCLNEQNGVQAGGWGARRNQQQRNRQRGGEGGWQKGKENREGRKVFLQSVCQSPLQS